MNDDVSFWTTLVKPPLIQGCRCKKDPIQNENDQECPVVHERKGIRSSGLHLLSTLALHIHQNITLAQAQSLGWNFRSERWAERRSRWFDVNSHQTLITSSYATHARADRFCSFDLEQGLGTFSIQLLYTTNICLL